MQFLLLSQFVYSSPFLSIYLYNYRLNYLYLNKKELCL